MTLLQFVTAECANLQPNGSCAGVMINPDLSMPRAMPRPRCLIAEGKRYANSLGARLVIPRLDI